MSAREHPGVLQMRRTRYAITWMRRRNSKTPSSRLRRVMRLVAMSTHGLQLRGPSRKDTSDEPVRQHRLPQGKPGHYEVVHAPIARRQHTTKKPSKPTSGACAPIAAAQYLKKNQQVVRVPHRGAAQYPKNQQVVRVPPSRRRSTRRSEQASPPATNTRSLCRVYDRQGMETEH